jgi:transposase
MAKVYSPDLRERGLDAVEKGRDDRRGAADPFGVSEPSAINWVERSGLRTSNADGRPQAPETGADPESRGGGAWAERPDQEQRSLPGRKLGMPYSSRWPKSCGILA